MSGGPFGQPESSLLSPEFQIGILGLSQSTATLVNEQLTQSLNSSLFVPTFYLCIN